MKKQLTKANKLKLRLAQGVISICDGGYGNDEANMKRIVDCVNACEGINPKAVPEMLEALKAMVHEDDDICKCPACKIGKPVIQKAEGE